MRSKKISIYFPQSMKRGNYLKAFIAKAFSHQLTSAAVTQTTLFCVFAAFVDLNRFYVFSFSYSKATA
jgi:hypothetical protein